MTLLKLAVRNLRRNRRRTTVTLVAMVITVIGMVLFRGFINGQREAMVENIIQGRLGAVQVHHRGYIKNVLTSPLQLDMGDTPELRSTLAGAPHVVAVAPRIEFGAMVSTPDPEAATEPPGKTSFFVATAIDPAAEAKVTPRRSKLVTQGRMFPGVDAPELVLNADFAQGLQAALHREGAPLPPVERQLALLAGDRDGALNGENVVLGGSYPTFSPGDKRNGLVPLAVAQRLLRMEGRVTEYALALDEPEQADQVKADLAARLGPGYEVHTWAELFPFIKVMASTQDFFFSIISAVFLVVVLLGIVNAMLMTVLERTREIGTMLAVGMRRRQIVRLFLLEGFVIGAFGSTLGLALGLSAVFYSNRHGIPLPAPGATVDSIIRPFLNLEFVLGVMFGVPVGAGVATLWPAWRASRLNPIEALATA